MSALARWDGFLAQIESRHREVLAADPSQTTSGETFSGAIASKPSPGAAMVSAKVCSVIRVRAAGAIALTWTP